MIRSTDTRTRAGARARLTGGDGCQRPEGEMGWPVGPWDMARRCEPVSGDLDSAIRIERWRSTPGRFYGWGRRCSAPRWGLTGDEGDGHGGALGVWGIAWARWGRSANPTVGTTPAQEHQRAWDTVKWANGGADQLRRGIARAKG
jgi:hypothetical protein